MCFIAEILKELRPWDERPGQINYISPSMPLNILRYVQYRVAKWREHFTKYLLNIFSPFFMQVFWRENRDFHWKIDEFAANVQHIHMLPNKFVKAPCLEISPHIAGPRWSRKFCVVHIGDSNFSYSENRQMRS